MIALPLLLLLSTTGADARLLDSVDTIGPWEAKASDGVSAKAGSVQSHDGGALRLDYDFHNVSGYAFVHRDLPLNLPENYVISFWVRGEGGANNFEFKLVDASGDNVWWHRKPDYEISGDWRKVTIRKRDIAFAWGPATEKELREAASIEFVVSRGRDGGKGAIEIDRIELTALPATPAVLPPPKLSSNRSGTTNAMDGNSATSWSGPGHVDIDFGGAREFGGLELAWAKGKSAHDYDIAFSGNGRDWRIVREVSNGNGGRDPIALPGSETRFVRLTTADSAALAEIAVKPLAYAETPNAFIASIAKDAPRGTYPRGFHDEQSYWTLIGTDGGAQSGLISEDGAIEVAKGGFSIEPFVIVDGKRFSWADVTTAHSLQDGYLPIPRIDWAGPGWRLETIAFADQSVEGGRLMARYRLVSQGTQPMKARLVLAIRPFQVNPPSQFLSQQGGVSAIETIGWADNRLTVAAPSQGGGHLTTLQPLRTPDRVVLASFDAGGALDNLDVPSTASVSDPTGLASAALVYDVEIAPGEAADIPVVIPFRGAEPSPMEGAAFTRAQDITAANWRKTLNAVTITVPASKQHFVDTLRSSQAHILMSRSGPVLKPGTRSYDRSWIRDGAMIGDGLLRLGQSDIVLDYARWYARHLFANGKVPCCIDQRGADPVPENDSAGEFIHLVTQLYRFTGDKAVLAEFWPRISAAQAYMESLRQTERTPTNLTPERRMLYGLMPPSISHEGYSAKPQYSLWDDLWALVGYKDAAYAAEVLGKPEAAELARQRDQFRADLHAAITAAAHHWKIDFIPGATSLGDFDATSTTVALDPAGEQAALDQRLLSNTFERYWREFLARRDGRKAWDAYTPYELRNISSFIRLGWRDRVDPLLDFFFDGQRPRPWNQWAEVVGRAPRDVRFVGDMPHAWISSDYIRAALDMFAYDRPEDGAIVLAAGLSPVWLEGDGSAIRGLHTPYGTLDFSISATPAALRVRISGSARPPGGFLLPWPLDGKPHRALINGKTVQWRGGDLHIAESQAPIEIEVQR